MHRRVLVLLAVAAAAPAWATNCPQQYADGQASVIVNVKFKPWAQEC